MALLEVLKYPDKRLHKIAKSVTQVNSRIQQIVSDMAQTMYAAPGVGLAATQVDIHERIIVIDITEEQNQLIALINPELVWASTEKKFGARAAYLYPNISMKLSAQKASKLKH